MFTKKIYKYSVILFFAGLFIWGCSNSNNPVSANSGSPGTLSMMAKYSNNPITGLQKTGSTQAVDSIVVTRVRVVLKDVKLEGNEYDHEGEDKIADDSTENNDDQDEADFKSGPFLLDLDLSQSMQQVSVSNIPFGTYDKVKFEIHKITQGDLSGLSTTQQAPFLGFLTDNGYSIIINGTIYRNGKDTSFTFKSSLDAEINMSLSPPLVVDSNNTSANMTLNLSTDGWFKTSDGTLLDPTDPNNTEMINYNLKKFIRVYKDDDRDGKEDD